MINTAKMLARCVYLEMIIECYKVPDYAAIAAELGVSVDTLVNETNKQLIKECQNHGNNPET